MERQHLVVRISDKKDRRTNLIHLTKDGKELEERARVIANQTLKEALKGITIEELSVSQEVLRKIFFNNTRTGIAQGIGLKLEVGREIKRGSGFIFFILILHSLLKYGFLQKNFAC